MVEGDRQELDFKTGKLVDKVNGVSSKGDMRAAAQVIVNVGDKRPEPAVEPMVTLSMRIPAWLKGRVEAWAKTERRKPSQMAAILVEEALDHREPKKAAR